MASGFHSLRVIYLIPISRVLLDLHQSDDFLWTYFDAQHKHILRTMEETYEAGVRAIQGLLLMYD